MLELVNFCRSITVLVKSVTDLKLYKVCMRHYPSIRKVASTIVLELSLYIKGYQLYVLLKQTNVIHIMGIMDMKT